MGKSALVAHTRSTGIYGGHPDLSCSGPGDRGCLGRSFGISDAWYQDGNSHGTHVAGTIGALGQNGNGVRGMVKDDHICYIFARVFDDAGNGASTSSILAAVRWAVNQGAQVINMSLGGSGYSATANAFYNKLFKDKGRIIVAAAGNDGGNVKSYPASYKRVVSVAAIDENMRRAYFSQANNMVDFAAVRLVSLLIHACMLATAHISFPTSLVSASYPLYHPAWVDCLG